MKLRRDPAWRPARDALEAVFVAVVDRGETDDPLVVDTVRVAHAAPVLSGRRARLVRIGGWAVAVVIGILLVIASKRVLPAEPVAVRIVGFVAICFGGVGMMLWHAEHERGHHRHNRGSEGRCRRCGYDLGGASSGVRVMVDGVEHDLGVRRCPECSQHWPLIFPL
ncbi:MAG: hypothetical protein LAT64_05345 [Phycisphaerales bacterium]|nr:hypothetical protein [Planctomycetota bacterium]MCH8508180.1 hypothetical protein [Phycisphaerales bacterium]